MIVPGYMPSLGNLFNLLKINVTYDGLPLLFFTSIGAFMLTRYFTICKDPCFAAECSTVSPVYY